MMNRQLPEHELVKRSRLGDERAFLELYLRHRDHVFGFAYRLLGEREAAEDVTQDCFLNLVRQLDRFDPTQASLGTYLYAMTRNPCYKHFRGVIEEEGPESLKDPEDGGNGPLSQLLEAELSTQVACAMATLPEFQREVLILFEFEGLTLAEIAVIAEVDVGAVKSRLYRARQQLRNALAPYLKKDSIRVAGRNEMTDEEKKKQLSQLTSSGLGESAKNVPNPDEDSELQTLLRQWQLPRSSPGLDRIVLTAYRNQVSSDGGWKRLFLRSIPIPLSLAAALLLVLVFLGSRTLRPPAVVRLEVPGPVPQVVRVEVPIVREKIVTRTVYRQSPETKNTGIHLKNDTARSTVDAANRGSRSSQIAVQLGDFEPVEKIQLKILKGVDQ